MKATHTLYKRAKLHLHAGYSTSGGLSFFDRLLEAEVKRAILVCCLSKWPGLITVHYPSARCHNKPARVTCCGVVAFLAEETKMQCAVGRVIWLAASLNPMETKEDWTWLSSRIQCLEQPENERMQEWLDWTILTSLMSSYMSVQTCFSCLAWHFHAPSKVNNICRVIISAIRVICRTVACLQICLLMDLMCFRFSYL